MIRPGDAEFIKLAQLKGVDPLILLTSLIEGKITTKLEVVFKCVQQVAQIRRGEFILKD